jgi:dihydroxycyclohexadiene carboxylate dehydrogenase
VCIVTGAGQGIGRATARRLGQECGKIVIEDRVDKGAAEAVIELRQYGVDRPRRWSM